MVNIATIGTSLISNDFIEVICANAGATYVGTLSRSAEHAASFTAERGGTHPFTSLDELAGCDEVDAVYIGSPNGLHAKQALACIAAGKHVIVEKPFASNEWEARRVFEAAEAAGVVALEAMRPLHDPAFRACQDAIGELGRVRRAGLHFGKFSSRYLEVLAGRQTNIFDCTMASGSLMDIGVYCVEPMIELFGAPERVASSTVLLDEETRGVTNGPIDGAGDIICTYADKTVVLHHSKITNDNLSCQVEGEDATLLFGGVSCPKWGKIEFRGEVGRSSAKAVRVASGAKTCDLELPACENTMCYELADFLAAIEAVRDGAAPADAAAGSWGTVAHYRDVTLASLAVMDEVRRQGGVAFPADEKARAAEGGAGAAAPQA